MPPESAPVFPLPDVVFFPDTILPLHIFEPRYRTMVEEALKGDEVIAMALLRPGWEGSYEGSPEIHPVGCLGQIRDAVRTEDGRYYLKLIGLQRVAFGEEVGSGPYRTIRISPLSDVEPKRDDPRNREDLVHLLGACAVLAQAQSGVSTPVVTLDEGLPYAQVVNAVCFHAGIPSPFKQALLEIGDVRERCLRLTEWLDEHLQQRLLSAGAQEGGDDGGLVN